MSDEFEYRDNESIIWQLSHEGDQVGAWENKDVERLLRDSQELHLRREVEGLQDEVNKYKGIFDQKAQYKYVGDSKYILTLKSNIRGDSGEYYGPYTLQELHNKLTELTEAR